MHDHMGSISSTFYEQLHAQIPKKRKKDTSLECHFCAFGICTHKSCAFTGWSQGKMIPVNYSERMIFFRFETFFLLFICLIYLCKWFTIWCLEYNGERRHWQDSHSFRNDVKDVINLQFYCICFQELLKLQQIAVNTLWRYYVASNTKAMP
jgi:hypothetical protein